jgi:hypothetical protein
MAFDLSPEYLAKIAAPLRPVSPVEQASLPIRVSEEMKALEQQLVQQVFGADIVMSGRDTRISAASASIAEQFMEPFKKKGLEIS